MPSPFRSTSLPLVNWKARLPSVNWKPLVPTRPSPPQQPLGKEKVT